jgi:hypothetical protein
LRLGHLPAVAGEVEQLEAEGLRWPRQLLGALAPGEGAAALRGRLGWSAARAAAVAAETELYLFKGLGAFNGRLLQAVGVMRVDDLAAWEPGALHAALERAAAERGLAAPDPDWVRVWVLASRSRGVLLRS